MEGGCTPLEEAVVSWTCGVFACFQDVESVRNTAVACIGHLFAYLTEVEPTLGGLELTHVHAHTCMHTHMHAYIRTCVYTQYTHNMHT